MVAVARSAALGASNPTLSEYIAIDGKLVAPVSLSFSIYDTSTSEKEDDPVLVEGPTTVDLDDDKVSTGRYAATWTVAADEALGRHQIVWTAVLVAGGPTRTWRRDFDVVQHEGIALGGYALISDLRAEGILSAKASNQRLAKLIVEATAFIKKTTGGTFEAEPRSYQLDGSGRDIQFLPEPIVAIESVSLMGTTLTADTYKVYTGATSPDDRWAPRLARLSALAGSPLVPTYAWTGAGYVIAPVWPGLRQNVSVKAIAGYLEVDGSPLGGTPLLIQKACRMLVIRNLPKLTDADGKAAAQMSHRLLSERTREQSYEIDKDPRFAAGIGVFTSDPEIDSILEMYMRPPYVGFAAV